MKLKFIAGALAGALFFGLCVSPSQALTFHFSFLNTLNGSGTALVEGTITGLIDNATSSATSVVVTANNPDGFGLGEYIGNPIANNFTVSNGSITFGHFFIWTINNSFPAVTCCGLWILVDTSHMEAGLSPDPNDPFFVSINTGSVTAATPLPAALPLFAGGLGALGLIGWRRKRKVQSSAA